MNDALEQSTVPFWTIKNIAIVGIISLVYLLLSYWLIGFRPEQVILVILFACMYFLSRPTRKFILAFSVFIIYWIVFDYMKAFPNYYYNTVHMESLYLADRKLFGINSHGSLISLNEYWIQHANSSLDVAAGLFYLFWIPLPLLFAAYLFYTDRRQFFLFSLTFFWVNIIGWIIYYSYPAAPPWYVQQAGLHFNPQTPGNVGGLGRFDQFFHVKLFDSIYAKSSNVFAAMPSLHSAYPMIVLYYGIKKKMGIINYLFAFIMVGIWFSAVYTSHHFVLDVIAGIACAIVGIFSFEIFVSKSRWFNLFIARWMNATL